MQPIERFKKTNTEGNLWIYILSLGKGQEICNKDMPPMIFEKFGFLPGGFLTKRVLMRLKQQGMASNERFKGNKAYKTTQKGAEQLEAMRAFCQSLLDKI